MPQVNDLTCHKNLHDLPWPSMTSKKYNFRGPQPSNRDPQDIYPVNGISFHPKHHGLLATVGSDGKYSFWDKVIFLLPVPIFTGSRSHKRNIFRKIVQNFWHHQRILKMIQSNQSAVVMLILKENFLHMQLVMIGIEATNVMILIQNQKLFYGISSTIWSQSRSHKN